jgi:triacylglycerol lipase
MLLSRVGEKTAILPQCAAPAVYPPDAMQKSLPRQTARSLNPPANVLEPYTFFESAGDHPFQPLDTSLNLRNAWWLADAALLAYSTEADVKKAFGSAGIAGEIAYFHGVHSTQAYMISMTDAIVLAFRGTQVDNFWSSVLDFAVDAQFLPLPDAHGHLVHAGFNAALAEVWTPLAAHLKSEQAKRPRPLWMTGHSLGAALATLAANRCCDDETAGLKGVYTFGSPRVGDPRFGQHVQVPVFRFRNDSDIVPHLPLGLVFRHLGHLQFIDGAGHLHRDLTSAMEVMLDPGAHFISPRDALSMQTLIRSGSKAELPVAPFLADHAPINYSILVWNCYDRERALTAVGG